MLEKTHKGQIVLWIVVFVAIVVLIALWLSKKPSALSITTPSTLETVTATSTASPSPTSIQNMDEIGKSLQDLNSSSSDIDKSLNDKQIDVMQ